MTSLLLCLLAADPAPNAQPADQLFQHARDLMKAHRAAEACPLLEKSQSMDPGLGTLLNLADCYEQTGRGVQAYLRFNEAVGWAQRMHEAKREEVAKERAAALKAKLSWLSLTATAPVPGLEVTVLGFQLPLAAGAESVPVDPGSLTVTAAAPGYVAWSAQITVGSSQVVAVSIPALAAQAGKDAPVAEASPPREAVLVPMAAAPSAPDSSVSTSVSTSAPKGPIVLAATGAALVVAGAVGLGWTYSTYGQLQAQQPGQPNYGRGTVTLGQFQTMQWLYPASWTALAVGGVAVATGGIWYLKTRPGVAVVPSPGGAAVAFSGTF